MNNFPPFAEYYDMNLEDKNIAYIFYSSSLDIKQTISELQTVLSTLNFNVSLFVDADIVNVVNKLNSLLELDHTNRGCVAVFLLLGHNSAYYEQEKILPMFASDRAPTLATKPKLFFVHKIQPRTETDSVSRIIRYPLQADYLMVTWKYGTFDLIQALCGELTEGRNEDLITTLTYVLNRAGQKGDELPSIMSMLTKKIKFHRIVQ